jgi:stearoyl-CoA desaturase (delta-9 desaturase)
MQTGSRSPAAIIGSGRTGHDSHWSLRFSYMILGASALQNSVLVWASGHRMHHQYVDDADRDPYSASRGLWFSHIGWMLRRYPSGEVDFSNVRDLQKDPLVAFQHRYYYVLAIGLNVLVPLALGWLHGDLWGVFLLAGVLRLVVSHHFTFLINSAAHAFGRQPYTDQNSARDNGWLAYLTYGEGYHNFHHQFAHDYRNGIRWWHWDPSKWIIWSLSWIGVTHRLKRTPDVVVQRARLAMQFSRVKASLERQRHSLPPTSSSCGRGLRANMTCSSRHSPSGPRSRTRGTRGPARTSRSAGRKPASGPKPARFSSSYACSTAA